MHLLWGPAIALQREKPQGFLLHFQKDENLTLICIAITTVLLQFLIENQCD